MTTKLLLPIFLVVINSHVAGADFIFETELEKDANFIKTHKLKLLKRYQSLTKYFQVKLSKPVKVQVLPYKKNNNFKNCARIYGPYRIYAHSLESLKQMPIAERKKFNSYCFKKDYDDLYDTLIHEFIHSLTFINVNSGNIPKWIWEGIALTMSEETKNKEWRRRALKTFSKNKKLNICSSDFKVENIYLWGGTILSYLHKQDPKFILNLVRHLRGDPNFSKAKSFLGKHSQSCSIVTSDLVKFLN